jgi:hypothetical protein
MGQNVPCLKAKQCKTVSDMRCAGRQLCHLVFDNQSRLSLRLIYDCGDGHQIFLVYRAARKDCATIVLRGILGC